MKLGITLSALAFCLCSTQTPALPRFHAPHNVGKDIHNTAIFGSDRRKAVSDLLDRDLGTSTVEERAVLQAAARTGQILCGNDWTNATLIQLLDGRDAIIAVAHAFQHKKTGAARCDLTKIAYGPNVSFFTGEPNQFNNKLTLTDGSLPLNHAIIGTPGQIPDEKDFLVFLLAQNVSQYTLPDGRMRGFMKLASDVNGSGKRFQIGFGNSFRNARTPSYEQCRSGVEPSEPNILYHFCATKDTSSGSALAELIGGELVLSGLHKAEWDLHKGRETVPMPDALSLGNIGVSIEAVTRFLSEQGHPAVLDKGISL